MHPRTFLDAFWRNDLRNEVFVAMPFRDDFTLRWQEIIRPAIENEPINGLHLRAVRVDIRKSGDSILTEIANGIAHSQLVLADISLSDRWQAGDEPLHGRNGNVMYELGLAMACRQPVEVVVIRDDNEALLFDVSSIPVLRYDLDDGPIANQSKIRAALEDRLQERKLVKDFRIAAARESLSTMELNLVLWARQYGEFWWAGDSLPAAAAVALPTLLQKRVFRMSQVGGNGEPHKYAWTKFGRAIAESLPTNPVA